MRYFLLILALILVPWVLYLLYLRFAVKREEGEDAKEGPGLIIGTIGLAVLVAGLIYFAFTSTQDRPTVEQTKYPDGRGIFSTNPVEEALEETPPPEAPEPEEETTPETINENNDTQREE